MFNLQGSEIIVILLLALVVLGPEKLPDAIRRFSRTYAELKKMGSGFQTELKSALEEPMNEMRETADLLQDAANPEKIAAQAEAEQTAAEQAAADQAAADQADQAAAHAAEESQAAAANAAAPAPDPDADTRPAGIIDPGSETVAEAAEPAPPINQIAAANASNALRPVDPGPNDADVPADTDTEDVPVADLDEPEQANAS